MSLQSLKALKTPAPAEEDQAWLEPIWAAALEEVSVSLAEDTRVTIRAVNRDQRRALLRVTKVSPSRVSAVILSRQGPGAALLGLRKPLDTPLYLPLGGTASKCRERGAANTQASQWICSWGTAETTYQGCWRICIEFGSQCTNRHHSQPASFLLRLYHHAMLYILDI